MSVGWSVFGSCLWVSNNSIISVTCVNSSIENYSIIAHNQAFSFWQVINTGWKNTQLEPVNTKGETLYVLEYQGGLQASQI